MPDCTVGSVTRCGAESHGAALSYTVRHGLLPMDIGLGSRRSHIRPFYPPCLRRRFIKLSALSTQGVLLLPRTSARRLGMLWTQR